MWSVVPTALIGDEACLLPTAIVSAILGSDGDNYRVDKANKLSFLLGSRWCVLPRTLSPRLHPGITQEVAFNEGQRAPKATTREALIYEALFVARWLQC